MRGSLTLTPSTGNLVSVKKSVNGGEGVGGAWIAEITELGLYAWRGRKGRERGA